MKIGWILTGSEDVASARIMGWNVHKWFVEHSNDIDISSEIIYYRKVRGIWTPDNLHINVNFNHMVEMMNGFDVIIFQKVCKDNSLPLLQEAKNMGIKTVYIIDDLIKEGIPMAKEANITVAGSEYIQKALKIEGIKSAIINDAYESPRELRKKAEGSQLQNPRVMWFGTVANLHNAMKLKWMTNHLNYRYDIISADMPGVTIKWSRFTIWDDLLKGDIIVIPCFNMRSEDRAKGNNRLTQSMVLGMPVIASPVPAYLKIIKNGINGFIAYSDSEWVDYLKLLKDVKVRVEVGNQAREDVIEAYSQESICKEWMRILSNGGTYANF